MSQNKKKIGFFQRDEGRSSGTTKAKAGFLEIIEKKVDGARKRSQTEPSSTFSSPLKGNQKL